MRYFIGQTCPVVTNNGRSTYQWEKIIYFIGRSPDIWCSPNTEFLQEDGGWIKQNWITGFKFKRRAIQVFKNQLGNQPLITVT